MSTFPIVPKDKTLYKQIPDQIQPCLISFQKGKFKPSPNGRKSWNWADIGVFLQTECEEEARVYVKPEVTNNMGAN